MENKKDTSCLKVKRQSQSLSFNLDHLDIEDEIIWNKYTQVRVIFRNIINIYTNNCVNHRYQSNKTY